MENYHVDLLVVLAPALASAVLCVAANMGALRALFATKVTEPTLKALTCREHVSTLSSVATNVMFVGSAVGVLYGSDGESPLDRRLGLVVGLVFAWVVARLSRHAAALARTEAEEQRQAIREAVCEAIEAERRASRRPSKRLARRARRNR